MVIQNSICYIFLFLISIVFFPPNLFFLLRWGDLYFSFTHLSCFFLLRWGYLYFSLTHLFLFFSIYSGKLPRGNPDFFLFSSFCSGIPNTNFRTFLMFSLFTLETSSWQPRLFSPFPHLLWKLPRGVTFHFHPHIY